MNQPAPPIDDPLTGSIIACCMRVHTELGPGLREHAYRTALTHELTKRGYRAAVEVDVPIVYGSVVIRVGYRIDILVEDKVVLELKTVDQISKLHKAQLIHYLELSGRKVGLLINFSADRIKNGLVRVFR